MLQGDPSLCLLQYWPYDLWDSKKNVFKTLYRRTLVFQFNDRYNALVDVVAVRSHVASGWIEIENRTGPRFGIRPGNGKFADFARLTSCVHRVSSAVPFRSFILSPIRIREILPQHALFPPPCQPTFRRYRIV